MVRSTAFVSRSAIQRFAGIGLWLGLALGLAGCDALGIDTPGKAAERKEAEGRAIGSACRHAVRSIEDCHATNPKASKAAIFTGWREMDEYMRENEIPGQPASPAPAPTGQAAGEEIIDPANAPASETAPTAQAAAAPTGAIALPAKPNIAPAH